MRLLVPVRPRSNHGSWPAARLCSRLPVKMPGGRPTRPGAAMPAATSAFRQRERSNQLRRVWSALDKATGQILWQTETPDPAIPGLGSAIGAVTVANGVAYACTFAGSHVAMNASNGSILWTDPSAGELCGAGAAVSRGTVYWGTGYGQIAFQPVTNGTLTAYGLW